MPLCTNPTQGLIFANLSTKFDEFFSEIHRFFVIIPSQILGLAPSYEINKVVQRFQMTSLPSLVLEIVIFTISSFAYISPGQSPFTRDLTDIIHRQGIINILLHHFGNHVRTLNEINVLYKKYHIKFYK